MNLKEYPETEERNLFPGNVFPGYERDREENEKSSRSEERIYLGYGSNESGGKKRNRTKEIMKFSQGERSETGEKRLLDLLVGKNEKRSDRGKRGKKNFLVPSAGIIFFLIFFSLFAPLAPLSALTSATGLASVPAEEDDIELSDKYFCALEDGIRSYIENYESSHDYDSYSYEIDLLYHDKDALSALISAMNPEGWTFRGVREQLDKVFSSVYILSEKVTSEKSAVTEKKPVTYLVRYLDGTLGYEVREVEVLSIVERRRVKVSLFNLGIDYAAHSLLSDEEYELYLFYLEILKGENN